jgi:hypothetical protein
VHSSGCVEWVVVWCAFEWRFQVGLRVGEVGEDERAGAPLAGGVRDQSERLQGNHMHACNVDEEDVHRCRLFGNLAVEHRDNSAS